MSIKYAIETAQPGDEGAVLAAFSHAFRDTRSVDVWRWMYRDNPDGSKNMICLAENGEVLAHQGMTFHRAIFNSNPIVIGQPRDAFSHPRYRALMKGRLGVYAQTARSIYADVHSVDFFYGFASAVSWRLGSKQMAYQEGTQWGRFRYSIPSVLSIPQSPYGGLFTISTFDSDFDALWLDRSKQLKAAAVHDSRFLSWRFNSASKRDYWLWGFAPYLATQTQGYVAFTRKQQNAILLDCHLPQNTRALWDFWRQIVEKLKWHGVAEVEVCLSLNHPDLPLLKELGFQAQPVDDNLKFGFREAPGGPKWQAINQAFCFTMADSDLY